MGLVNAFLLRLLLLDLLEFLLVWYLACKRTQFRERSYVEVERVFQVLVRLRSLIFGPFILLGFLSGSQP